MGGIEGARRRHDRTSDTQRHEGMSLKPEQKRESPSCCLLQSGQETEKAKKMPGLRSRAPNTMQAASKPSFSGAV